MLLRNDWQVPAEKIALMHPGIDLSQVARNLWLVEIAGKLMQLNKNVISNAILPYKLRGLIDRWLVYRSVHQVQRTPPVESADRNFLLTIHLLLRQQDLLLGLIAVKSLLRFESRIRVVITNDGSCNDRDLAMLKRHIRGVTVLDRRELLKKSGSKLDRYPVLHRLYMSDFHMIAKLLHPMLLCGSGKICILDADTAFLSRPDKLLDWATSSTKKSLYLHDSPDRNQAVPWLPAFFCANGFSSNDLENSFCVDNYFFNAGCLAFVPESLDLAQAEKYLAWHARQEEFPDHAMSSVWFGDWTREQTAYLCMFLRAKHEVEGLGAEYTLGAGPPNRTFHHFLRGGVVSKRGRSLLKDLCTELTSS